MKQERKKAIWKRPIVYVAYKIKKLQEELANNHIENESETTIHPKELPQIDQSLEKQLAEAREEKGDLEKTYRYAVHVNEMKKLQEKLANHHIENEDGQRQILCGESGITYL